MEVCLLVAVRADVEAVRLRHPGDLHELGHPTRIARIGLEDGHRLRRDQVAKAVLGVLVLARGDRNEVAAAIFLKPS